jgi:hypothetical protein
MGDPADRAPLSFWQDQVRVALDLISEVERTINQIERDAAARVAQAEDLAKEALENLRRAELRADRSEANLLDLRQLIADIKNESDQALLRCAAEIAAAQESAALSETRATQSQAAIDRIVRAMRDQLPIYKASAIDQQIFTRGPADSAVDEHSDAAGAHSKSGDGRKAPVRQDAHRAEPAQDGRHPLDLLRSRLRSPDNQAWLDELRNRPRRSEGDAAKTRADDRPRRFFRSNSF